jgi:hypothetical protein
MATSNKKCSCGEAAVGGRTHSSYCDLLKKDEPKTPVRKGDYAEDLSRVFGVPILNTEENNQFYDVYDELFTEIIDEEEII